MRQALLALILSATALSAQSQDPIRALPGFMEAPVGVPRVMISVTPESLRPYFVGFAIDERPLGVHILDPVIGRSYIAVVDQEIQFIQDTGHATFAIPVVDGYGEPYQPNYIGVFEIPEF